MAFKLEKRLKELISFIAIKPTFREFLGGLLTLLKGNHITRIVTSGNVVFSAPDNSFLTHIVKEVFVNGCYERGEVRLDRHDTVVDIGSNVGVFSVSAAEKVERQVFAFEPFPDNFQCLVQNIETNHLTGKIVPVQKAVTNRKGLCQLVVSRSSGGNILDNECITRQFHGEDRITVETISLEEVFDYTETDRIDFLKLDCEGSEGAIIMTLNEEQIKRIRKIAMEYHNDASILTHLEIKEKLESLGCKVSIVARRNSPYGFIYAYNPAYVM